MGRELQKKKNRSSNAKIRQRPRSKRVNPCGNPIIAANWDSKQTLTQNYRRLGLTSRLSAAAGGSEVSASLDSTQVKLSVARVVPKTIIPTEARIERDEGGRVVRVHHLGRLARHGHNPLNDPLQSEDEDQDVQSDGSRELRESTRPQNAIVRALEEQAALVPEKKARHQSQREREWIESLVARHGDDFAMMSRDRKLNPMQQTEADICRRVRLWKANGGTVGA